MTFCALCQRAIRAGEKSARFYVPIRPEHITRAHLACFRARAAEAPHEDLAPVVVN